MGIITPVIGEMRDLMITGETLIIHPLLDVITTEKGRNHRILDQMGEEMVLLDHMGEEMVLTDQGQVLLVLVQAGEGLHHFFKARMVVDIHGVQEKVLFAGIQNLLIRDND